MPLRAYHGDPAIKAALLAKIAAHREANGLVKGATEVRTSFGLRESFVRWIEGERYHHTDYPEQLGLPEWLAVLRDSIFNALPFDRAMEWPERLAEAIEPSAEIEPVMARFYHWMLVDPSDGILFSHTSEHVRSAVEGVAALVRREVDGENVSRLEWTNAQKVASLACAENVAWGTWNRNRTKALEAHEIWVAAWHAKIGYEADAYEKTQKAIRVVGAAYEASEEMVVLSAKAACDAIAAYSASGAWYLNIGHCASDAREAWSAHTLWAEHCARHESKFNVMHRLGLASEDATVRQADKLLELMREARG